MRVAVICDYLEENWPSMDLNGDQLHQFLVRHCAQEVSATQVRPDFHRRFMHVPGLPRGLAWNTDRLLNRFVDYPRALRGRGSEFDLFHIVDHSYSQLAHSLPAKRTVVTCHDLDTFRCVIEPEREPRSPWFRAMAGRILAGFERAAHVICNSWATRNEILSHQLFPPERLTVIHVGVHPDMTSVPDAAADAEACSLLPPKSEDEVLLLSVGTTIPRKRIDVLLRVFAAIRKTFPGARLVRVGGPFTVAQSQLAKDLGVEQDVLAMPFLERKVLASIYRRATLLLQPSESEGFGMPLTEAMACGCPVIASDLNVLREVGGSACTYCPVGDVDAWKGAVVRLLGERFAANNTLAPLRQEALARASQFSWTANARSTAAVYREVLERSSS